MKHLRNQPYFALEADVVEIQCKQVEDKPRYELSVPTNVLSGIYDLYLNIDHVCDYMTASVEDHLIGDWYYSGEPYRPSIQHWGTENLGKTITLDLTPITAQTHCYIEERFRPDFSAKPAYAEVRSVGAIPLYRVLFTNHLSKNRK